MKHILKSLTAITLFSIFLFTTASFAQTQSLQPTSSTVPSVSGTTWVGPDTHGRNYTYVFNADGSLTYTYETGTFTDGNWTQDDNIIHITMNKKFSERLGHITGTHMEGDAWNVKGEKWTWQAELK